MDVYDADKLIKQYITDDIDMYSYDMHIDMYTLENEYGYHSYYDRPALILPSSGVMSWYYDNKLHRDGDKPAFILRTGSPAWLQHGALHRVGKPAALDGLTPQYYNHGDCITHIVEEWANDMKVDLENMSHDDFCMLSITFWGK